MGEIAPYNPADEFVGDNVGFALLNLTSWDRVNGSSHADDNDVFRITLVWLNIYFTPLIIIVGLIGNMLSCLVFSFTYLRRQSSSLYLTALALADIGYLGALFFIWMERIGIHIFHRERWCQSVIYITKVSGFLAIWNVVSFTSERYIIVYNPLRKDMLCTKKKAKVVIFSLLSFSLVIYGYIFWLYDVVRFGHVVACSPVPHHYDVITIMSTVDTILACVIPSFVIIVLNIRIIVKIHHYQERWKDIYRSPLPSCDDRKCGPAHACSGEQNCAQLDPISLNMNDREHSSKLREKTKFSVTRAEKKYISSFTDKECPRMTSFIEKRERSMTSSVDKHRRSVTSSSGRHDDSRTSFPEKHRGSITSLSAKCVHSSSSSNERHGPSYVSCMSAHGPDRSISVLEPQDRQRRQSIGHGRPVLHASLSTAGTMHIKFSPSEKDPDVNSIAATSLLGTRINRHKTARLLKVQSQFRTARMLLILSSVFVLLNLPNYVLQILSFLHHLLGRSAKQSKEQGKWQELFHLVYFVNFAINFFIYSACGRQFRTGLMRLCHRWKYSLNKFGQIVRQCGRSIV